MKSPSSMRNGRFHPSKCRDKVQKMGVMYTHFPKIAGQSFTTPKKILKNQKFGKKGGTTHSLSDYKPWLVGDHWLLAGPRPLITGRRPMVVHRPRAGALN